MPGRPYKVIVMRDVEEPSPLSLHVGVAAVGKGGHHYEVDVSVLSRPGENGGRSIQKRIVLTPSTARTLTSMIHEALRGL